MNNGIWCGRDLMGCAIVLLLPDLSACALLCLVLGCDPLLSQARRSFLPGCLPGQEVTFEAGLDFLFPGIPVRPQPA